MSFWLFSSNNVDNIRRAYERLMWGFWDREAGEKQRKNWRSFIRAFNRIKPFHVVVFQVARSGEVHAIGVVKETYYDDQTPIWDNELEQNRVLYPWKVSLSTVLFSEKPFVKHFIKIENYIDGYGIGEIPEHEFRKIFDDIKSKLSADLNLGV
jgi:hypothetical protein